MKFKTRREVIKENVVDNMESSSRNAGVVHGVTAAWGSCAERVKFYDENHHPSMKATYLDLIPKELRNKYVVYLRKNNLVHTVLTYNNWLFKHCFEDMMI